jgi:CRP-like cAMP-binding protein
MNRSSALKKDTSPVDDQRSEYRNKLLANLLPDDIDLLSPHLELVTIKLRQEIERPDTPITEVFFPQQGLLSVVAVLPRNRDIEVGVIGCDGMSGTAIVQSDDRSPFSTFVQIEGTALKLDAQILSQALAKSTTMRSFFNRYVRSQAMQVASTALANGRSKLEERLARWLLMVQDRLDSDKVTLTHEFLAVMLGVRRPGVTVALHILEGKGLIRSNRGEVLIRDREGLIELADGAYGTAEGEYRRLMGMPS